MYCPKCAQERLSDASKFCSRCGYLLTGTADLLANDGVIPGSENTESPKPHSPRNRGVKQGVFIFLTTFFVVPVIMFIESSFNELFNVTLITTVVLAVGGLLRIAYALMFETGASSIPATAAKILENKTLPARDMSLDDFFAAPITDSWRNTEELNPEPLSQGETKKLKYDADQ